MRKLTKRNKTQLMRTATDEECRWIVLKLVLECWNANLPHFGGCMPHRYDGADRFCAYCNRPKDWTPVNPGVTASDLLYGEAS